MQQTICAKVNPRLLTKADRLFIGSVDGRIIEILQNARRAGATEVRISNKDGLVTVQDNGSGIDDFQKLLDLGGSGWDEKLEAGEDPAGVGLFSLAPRKVTIISGGRKTVIDKDGWTGKPVEVTENTEAVTGTILKFRDEKPWDMNTVEKHAVFAGIKVVVDGKYCHAMSFCNGQAEHYDKPGCRIEVAEELYIVGPDMIFYGGVYYGDWSVFGDAELKEDDFELSMYDPSKAKPPKIEKRQAKIIVYIKGGICQDVKANIPEQLWDYAIVDYDNDPDLPDDYVPFSKDEMEPLFL